MRSVRLVLVLAMACGKARGPHTELVYELDLELAVVGRLATIRDEVATRFAASKLEAHATLSDPRTLVLSPGTPAIEAALRTDYGDTLFPVACPPGTSDPSTCVVIAPNYAKEVRVAAFEQARRTVMARLEGLKLENASVRAKDDQLIVEFADKAQLDAVHDVLKPTGALAVNLVDDGATYMTRLAAQVANDPTANGIHTEPDQWSAEGKAHTDPYLWAPERKTLERFLESLGSDFAMPDDRAIGFERLEPATPAEPETWRTFYLVRPPVLTNAAIADAQSKDDTVRVTMTPLGAKTFGDVSGKSVGRKVAVIVDGQVLTAPVLMAAITGSELSISMGRGMASRQKRLARELALILKSGALPGPLREVSAKTLQ